MFSLNRSKRLRVISIFLVLIGIFFYKQLFFGNVIFCCDNATINIPASAFFANEVKQGRFPLWNPYIFSGVPHFADINLGVLNPLNVLYLWMSPFKALTEGVIVSFLIALVGVFVLCRQLKFSLLAALYSSIIFSFSGTIVSYTNNVSMLHVAVLLPWVLWSVIVYMEKPEILRLSLAAIIISLQIISGHPQITYLTLVTCAFLFVMNPTRLLKDKFRYGFVLAVFAIGLSAIQIIPFIEFASLSSRVGLGVAYATSGSFSLLGAFRLLLPNIVGDLSTFGGWMQNGSLLGYVGITPLLLCFVPAQKNYYRQFFVWTLVITLLAAFGSHTPFYYFFYYLLPGLRFLRSPEQFLVIYTVSVAIISGYGLDSLIKHYGVKTFSRYIRFVAIFSLVAFFISLIGISFPNSISLLVNKISLDLHLAKLAALDASSIAFILRYVSQNIFMSSVMMLVMYLSFANFKKYNTYLLITVLTFLELAIFSSHNIISYPEKIVQYNSLNTILSYEGIKDFDWKQNRILVDQSAIRYPASKPFPKYQYAPESLWQLANLKPNVLMELYPRADGYGSLIYEKYRIFINAKSTGPTGVTLKADNPLNRLLGIKYLIASSGQDVKVLKTDYACDRIFILKNDLCVHNSVQIEQYVPNYIKIKTHSNEDTSIVFTDVNYPGWYARVNGQTVQIVEYKKIFKSVPIKSGESTIEFYYRPLLFIFGLIISGLSLGVVVVIVISAIVKSRQSSGR